MNLSTWSMSLLTILSVLALAAEASEAQEQPSGVGDDALPSLHRAEVGELLRPGISASASLGYGFTESVLADSDQHHSGVNKLGVSYAVNPWFGMGLGVLSRVDLHRNDFDTTLLTLPSISARGVFSLDHEWTAGLQLTAWFPTFSAASVDALFMASKQLKPSLREHFNVGFRLDRSSEAIKEDRIGIMSTDLLTLGASDSNAILVAAGMDWKINQGLQVFGEWSYDLLIGENSPDIQKSPMRVALGARFPIADAYQMSVGVETNFSRVPVVDGRLPLAPVEPIAALQVSLSHRPAKPLRQLVSSYPVTGRIEGVVAAQDDSPIAGAVVSLGERQVLTGADGSFIFGDLEPGASEVTITAAGYVVTPLRAQVIAGRVLRIPVVAVAAGTPGQIRIFVRGGDGTGIAASVRVLPGSDVQKTDGEGSLEVELRPGSYKVSVEAEGFEEQTRMVTVDPYGVTILNLDLMTVRQAK